MIVRTTLRYNTILFYFTLLLWHLNFLLMQQKVITMSWNATKCNFGVRDYSLNLY